MSAYMYIYICSCCYNKLHRSSVINAIIIIIKTTTLFTVIRTHIYVYVPVYVRVHACVYIRTCKYIQMDISIHPSSTYIHTHTHTYIHTYTRALP